MEWNEEIMSTGVELVDSQHKEIIRRVNNLKQVAECGGNALTPEINHLIDFLADYVIAHFLSEETLQMKINYADFEAHKLEHEGFIHNFTDMRDMYQRSGATNENIQALISMSESWLIEHIAGSDSRFAACYRASKL